MVHLMGMDLMTHPMGMIPQGLPRHHHLHHMVVVYLLITEVHHLQCHQMVWAINSRGVHPLPDLPHLPHLLGLGALRAAGAGARLCSAGGCEGCH